MAFDGEIQRAIDFLQKEVYYDKKLWATFVDQFRLQDDGYNLGWRGEYWGKAMRGAVLVYQYSKDEKLYEVLNETVLDMLTVAEDNGRFSCYSVKDEFKGWDMWSRKYVLLGFEYFIEICRDEELKEKIITALCKHLDYIIEHVGDEPQKIPINKTSQYWKCLNSSSILQPVVKLYNLTKEQRYLDFASYIVKEGGADGINIFELAYQDEIPPYQYGAPKAYEMMSCFEGLAEYYLSTGIEKWKTAVINFSKKLIKTEYTAIGCLGTTHEMLDFGAARQTVFYDGASQETCVCVTFINFCKTLFEITGDTYYLDKMEYTFHNVYLGAFNYEHKICFERSNVRTSIQVTGDMKPNPTVLPFDSYSPILPSNRGRKIAGGQMFRDGSHYGCCACIGGAGIGTFLKTAFFADKNAITVNHYLNGIVQTENVLIYIETDYPTDEKIKITIYTEECGVITLKLRIPDWCKKYTVDLPYTVNDNYITVTKKWKNGDSVTLNLDMPIIANYPMKWDSANLYIDRDPIDKSKFFMRTFSYDEKDSRYVNLQKGPICLCADSRLDKSADDLYDIKVNADNTVDFAVSKSPFESRICLELTENNGNKIRLVDYACAGRDWETMISPWLKTSK